MTDKQCRPSTRMTVHGQVGDHPRGNFWFADRLLESEPGYDAEFPWRAFLQVPGMVFPVEQNFASEEAAEEFIKNDILGAGAEFGGA